MGKTGSQSTPQNSVDFGTTFLKYYNERYSKTTLSKIDDFIDHFEKHGLFGPPAWIGKVSPSYKVPDQTTESQIEQSTRLFGNAPAPRTPSQFTEMTARKHIVIMTCNFCGKVKKIVTNV